MRPWIHFSHPEKLSLHTRLGSLENRTQGQDVPTAALGGREEFFQAAAGAFGKDRGRGLCTRHRTREQMTFQP